LSPSPTVVIVPANATDGTANIALEEALRRIADLENKLAQAQSTADIAMQTATSAQVSTTLATTEPEAPLVTEEVIPESSDDGPPAKEEEKPVAKKPAWHHWI
jgi:hypothetical protein